MKGHLFIKMDSSPKWFYGGNQVWLMPKGWATQGNVLVQKKFDITWSFMTQIIFTLDSRQIHAVPKKWCAQIQQVCFICAEFQWTANVIAWISKQIDGLDHRTIEKRTWLIMNKESLFLSFLVSNLISPITFPLPNKKSTSFSIVKHGFYISIRSQLRTDC